jgi:hypothetical protein
MQFASLTSGPIAIEATRRESLLSVADISPLGETTLYRLSRSRGDSSELDLKREDPKATTFCPERK